MCLLGGEILFSKITIFFLKAKRFENKWDKKIFFPANCFKNLLWFLKNTTKNEKNTFFLPSTRQKSTGSNEVF